MEVWHELIDVRSGRTVSLRERPTRISGDETLRAEVAAYFAGPVDVLAPATDCPQGGRGTALRLLQPEEDGWFEACLYQASAELGLRHLRRLGTGVED